MSFFLVLLPFFGRFSLLIVLYGVSAHPWHCDLLCCFIWHLSKMQLVVTALFISILYEQSQHLFDNVAQLLRGSFQTTWNFFLDFFLAVQCCLSQFFLSHRKIRLGKFCSDVWDGELKERGDKGTAPIGNETWGSEWLWRKNTKVLAECLSLVKIRILTQCVVLPQKEWEILTVDIRIENSLFPSTLFPPWSTKK